MTTDNTIKQGDTVKVIDAQHYAAGNVGVVKTITKDVHKVEVVLANGVKETIDFVKEQLGGEEDEVKQGLGITKAPEPEVVSAPFSQTEPVKSNPTTTTSTANTGKPPTI